jgi:sodium-dependent dicarboxylate transporter 2/3/5
MLPVGWLMVFLLWGFFMIFFRPEKKVIPGLRQRAIRLNNELGPITRKEIVATCIIVSCVLVMSLRSFIPALKPLDKTAIIVTSTILFFITGILDVDDLEEIPWDIILLFAGAISLGFCLWETGAAKWLAVKWLMKLEGALTGSCSSWA